MFVIHGHNVGVQRAVRIADGVSQQCPELAESEHAEKGDKGTSVPATAQVHTRNNRIVL